MELDYEIEKINDFYLPKADCKAVARNLGQLVAEEFICNFDFVRTAITGKDKIIFDIGAFIGGYTSLFLRYGATVYAFEPNLIPYKCLCLNCPDAKTFNFALGTIGMWTKFEGTDRSGNLGGSRQKPVSCEEIDAKQVMTLDDFQDIERCDFLKIDVEGFEPYVIRGGQKFIEKFKPIIFVEKNRSQLACRGFTVEQLCDEITQLGYSLKVGLKHDLIFTL